MTSVLLFLLFCLEVLLAAEATVRNDGYIYEMGIKVPYISIYSDSNCDVLQYYEDFTNSYYTCSSVSGGAYYVELSYRTESSIHYVEYETYAASGCSTTITSSGSYTIDDSCKTVNGAYVRYTCTLPDVGYTLNTPGSMMASLRVFPNENCTDVESATDPVYEINGDFYSVDAFNNSKCSDYVNDQSFYFLQCPHLNFTSFNAPYYSVYFEEGSCENQSDFRSIHSRAHEFGNKLYYYKPWETYVRQECIVIPTQTEVLEIAITEIFADENEQNVDDKMGMVIRILQNSCAWDSMRSQYYQESCHLDNSFDEIENYGIIRKFEDGVNCDTDYDTMDEHGISGYVDYYIQADNQPSEFGMDPRCVSGMNKMDGDLYMDWDAWDGGGDPEDGFTISRDECWYSSYLDASIMYLGARCYDEYNCYGLTSKHSSVCNSGGMCTETDCCTCHSEKGYFGKKCQEKIGKSTLFLGRDPIEIQIEWRVPKGDVYTFLGSNAPCDLLVVTYLGENPFCEFRDWSDEKRRRRRRAEEEGDFFYLVIVASEGNQIDYRTDILVRPVTNSSMDPMSVEHTYSFSEEGREMSTIGFFLYSTLALGIICYSFYTMCCLCVIPICFCGRQVIVWVYRGIKKLRKRMKKDAEEEDGSEEHQMNKIRRRVRREIDGNLSVGFQLLSSNDDDDLQFQHLVKDKDYRRLERQYKKILEEEELSKIKDMGENEDD